MSFINVALPFIPDKETVMYLAITPKTKNCIVAYFESAKDEYLTRVELKKDETGVFVSASGFWKRLVNKGVENT
jgi:tRNA(Ile2) C34 agmatinyltransferase TiaS